MNIIRVFWGDFYRYKNQIINSKQYNLNETVFVWGKENYNNFVELGFKAILLNENKYDNTIANGHTFDDYRSLTHKIAGINFALENYFDEIIFLDWDMILIKEIDSNFYGSIRDKNSSLQVPLYVYPKIAFDFLLTTIESDSMKCFIQKLKENVIKYSYETDLNYVLPNTGFIYCSDKKLTKKLLEIISDLSLETVPDELSVYLLTQSSINEYIKKYEPVVVGVKKHGFNWWDEQETILFENKKSIIKKDVYFEHL